MLCKKVALISLITISTGIILPVFPAFARTLNQEINAQEIASEGVLYANKNWKHPKPHHKKPHHPKPHHKKPHHPKPHHKPHQPHQNINKTTVVTPVKSSSNSHSSSNSNSISKSRSSSNSHSSSNSSARVNNSGNSSNTNTNSNISQGGSATVGGQQSQQSVTTGSTSVSPSTRVKVDGDKYNSVHFGDQAPGTGSEAFSFQYRSACGASINYRQGFGLKPRRIAAGGLGFALDVSSTSMDTIESREGVQKKMDTAFITAMKVVDNQEIFQQRLNSGVVSYQEAQSYAIANCAPHYPIVHKTSTPPKIQIRPYFIKQPRRSRVCTARGCN
ncbi:MAG: hypothetical protein AAFX80_17595 [Cyanobacteria bacterium J06639_18]